MNTQLIGIDVGANNLAAITDPPDLGGPGARDINRRELVAVVQKPMRSRFCAAIEAHDLTSGIDLNSFSHQGAGDVNGGKAKAVSLDLERSQTENTEEEQDCMRFVSHVVSPLHPGRAL